MTTPDRTWDDTRHDIILCNFGGPTSAPEVEPFLIRLFEDPFIIRSPFLGPWLRGKLARRIARKRAPKVAEEYASIGFSPINRMTAAQAKFLEERLRKKRPNTHVHIVNRYTPPFAADVVKTLVPEGSRLFILSLYPHICHSTTVSSFRDFDIAFENHFGHRDVPSVRIFSWWHNRKALDYSWSKMEAGLRKTLAAKGDDKAKICIVFSAHGVPARYDRRGDPYVNEILAHYNELRKRGDVWLKSYEGGKHYPQVTWHLSFQSRVGPVEWVKPYTDETIRVLGKSHGGTILMVPISFTADHIETLYEMDHTYKTLALESGFKSYQRVEPANDDPVFADGLVDVLEQHGF